MVRKMEVDAQVVIDKLTQKLAQAEANGAILEVQVENLQSENKALQAQVENLQAEDKTEKQKGDDK